MRRILSFSLILHLPQTLLCSKDELVEDPNGSSECELGSVFVLDVDFAPREAEDFFATFDRRAPVGDKMDVSLEILPARIPRYRAKPPDHCRFRLQKPRATKG